MSCRLRSCLGVGSAVRGFGLVCWGEDSGWIVETYVMVCGVVGCLCYLDLYWKMKSIVRRQCSLAVMCNRKQG